MIDLHDDAAPKTCAAIWEALVQPVRIPVMHAMFAGSEIMLELPPEAQRFDPRGIQVENQTCFRTRDGLDAFAAICARIGIDGVKTLEISRI